MNIKWRDQEPKVNGQSQSVGTCQGRVYVILRERDGTWRSAVVERGQLTVLSEDVASGHIAYRACTDHNLFSQGRTKVPQ
jgi:hypothetical protein